MTKYIFLYLIKNKVDREYLENHYEMNAGR